jgi:hypothetical protein
MEHNVIVHTLDVCSTGSQASTNTVFSIRRRSVWPVQSFGRDICVKVAN